MENEKKSSILDTILGRKKEPEFTAELAWVESTYGDGSYQTIEERIKEKQDYIKSSIKGKFPQIVQNGYVNYHRYSTYHCVIDIEDDLADYVNEIFEPFVSKGFKFINLSEQVEEIDEPHVYLVSWKHAFKKKEESKDTGEQVEPQLIEE